MQAFLNTRFSSDSIQPILVLNEINQTIREHPSTNPRYTITNGFTIDDVRREREEFIQNNQHRLPDQIFELHQICQWVEQIQRNWYSFENITQFLTDLTPTDRSLNEYDFIKYFVNIKFILTYN